MNTSETAIEPEKEKEEDQITNNSNNNESNNYTGNSLDSLISIAREKGFETEENKDYGAGPIDLVWNITMHPAYLR
jgi:hypothetical protein